MTQTTFDFSHLNEGVSCGTGFADALLMYAIVQMISPKTIVEFGFYRGYSAVNFLKAMPTDCKLFSFDPDIDARDSAQNITDPRFKFIHKKGESFEGADINGELIDVLFFDTNHKFLTNINIFRKVEKSLSDHCILLVHDTGLFNKEFMLPPWSVPGSFYVTEKGYAHQPQERLFVNYLKDKYPEFSQIHLHTERVGRMGMTLLMRSKKLSLGGRSLKLWLAVLSPIIAKYVPRFLKKTIKTSYLKITGEGVGG